MTTRQLLHRLLSRITGPAFAVRFWDGETVHYGPGPAEFVLRLHDEAACRRAVGNLEVGFGDAYVSGAIEVEGDLGRVLRLMYASGPETFSLGLREKLALARAAWPQRNPLAQSRRNVAVHYDLGNEFFKLWLDKQMIYSCAYFARPDEDIDTAQERKLRHICAKLALREGSRLLDVGCGWGGLLVHAATHHGARGLGITLSVGQEEEARRRIAAHGLGDRIAVELRDYRQVAGAGEYDAVVSVGMFEHVGRRNYPGYFRHTARLLREGGVGVLHTIGKQVAGPPSAWITKHIFPGTYFPSLDEVVRPLTASALRILDVEVWKVHYALTLERWLEAYEANVERIRAMYGEPFTRMWRLYLAGCAASFRYGDTCVWQIQFAKGPTDAVPMTRDYLYRSEA